MRRCYYLGLSAIERSNTMKSRSAIATIALFLITALSIAVFALQAPPAGQRGGGGQAPAPGGAAAGAAGQRGTAPAGQLPGRGAARLPPEALPPGAPHPDPLPIDIFTTKNFYKDKALWSD